MNTAIGRIVMIEGLWRYDEYLALTFERAFKKQFPNALVACEYIPGCWPYEIGRLLKFVAQLAKNYDDGVPVLIAGHSVGGLIACALDAQLTNSPVVGITTICTPHQYAFGAFAHLLEADHELSAPIITFQAKYDFYVPYGTWHRKTKGHEVLLSDHRDMMIMDEAHSRRIAESAYEHFS